MTAGERPAVGGGERAAFDRHLADADEAAAVGLVLGLLDRGVAAEELLLGLVAPAQEAVGLRWAANEWSVAQEHAATYVSEQAVAAVAAATRGVRADRGSVVVACPDGEWHTLPARVVAEVLRLHGFAVRFLGAAVPTPHLVSYLHQSGAGVVALSCMLPVRLPGVHRTIEGCRAAGVPVLAGGAGFGPDGVWARVLGADLYAGDAAGAAAVLAERWPPPLCGRAALDHLADGEYARLATGRAELLRHVVAELDRRFPPMRRYDDQQRERTTEDLCFLLDYLAAAVFVDDPRVLTDFLAFAAGVLAARGVPPSGLRMAVEALGGPLAALPRSTAHLAAGLRRLEREG